MPEFTTAQDFIDHIRREIQDTDSLKYTDQELIAYLNRAQRQIAFQIAQLWPYYHIRTSNMAENTYDLLMSLVSSDYQWSASSSGTSEYYLEVSGGGDPSVSEPSDVYEDGDAMTEGTLGSLAQGEWGWGNNDSLSFKTVYVRLSDDADPDSKSDGYVKKDKTEYALPTDCYEIMSVDAKGNPLPVLNYQNEFLPDTKSGYILENDNLVLNEPATEEGTLTVKYVSNPTVLTATGDNLDYAGEFPDVIVEIVCMMCRGRNMENPKHHLNVLGMAKKLMMAHVTSVNQPEGAQLGLDVSSNWL